MLVKVHGCARQQDCTQRQDTTRPNRRALEISPDSGAASSKGSLSWGFGGR